MTVWNEHLRCDLVFSVCLSVVYVCGFLLAAERAGNQIGIMDQRDWLSDRDQSYAGQWFLVVVGFGGCGLGSVRKRKSNSWG